MEQRDPRTESSGGCAVGGALQPAMLRGIGKVRVQFYSGSLKGDASRQMNAHCSTLPGYSVYPPPPPTQPCFIGADYPGSPGTAMIKTKTKTKQNKKSKTKQKHLEVPKS